MKTITKVTLITALLLLLGGLLLGVGTLAAAGLPFGEDYRTYRTEHPGDMAQISTDLGSASLLLKSTSGEKIIVICNDIEDDRRITVTEREGGLHIAYRAKPWFMDVRSWISFGEDPEYDVEIAIPEQYAGQLDIEARSGKIAVRSIDCTSGKIDTTSGTLRLDQLRCTGDLEIEHTSGSVVLEQVWCGGGLTVDGTSGHILLDRVSAERSVTVESTSGALQLENVTAGGAIKARLTSGAINVITCQSGEEIDLRTSSGAIRGRFLTAESIAAETTSGLLRLRVMDADAIRLETTSGDIVCSVPGKQEEYTITSSTVSGSNGLPEHQTGGRKTLAAHTTSGMIRMEFHQSAVTN